MLAEKSVLVSNARGPSPFVIVCDHASNHLPAQYGDLGLTPSQRLSHIAWDPGALAVSRHLSEMLDAPLVQSTFSRLIVDPNRSLEAPDLIWTLSEATRIPGNENISAEERQFRIDHFHRPYHASIETLLEARRHAGQETILVCMHSFTPVYHGVARPWPIGVIHGVDIRFTQAFFDALQAEDPAMNVGWNLPYAALQGITLTLERHGDGRGLEATMIEIRHDEILDPTGVNFWSGRIATCLQTARQARRSERFG
ncbi:N-formylglutamate amidohydrolase [Devosia sp. RR2S18]|uniref:N-formylglutamate amidohydrolase n=1 Tax=Devosia rhizosphaerae TaxID=3049774 RepID=UPI0025419FD9|nr:N-formylglutamate amidohydrolase [Devosia sp. RR2S18]WIJ24829.1 N-formylglutamate amidohydrolase [Devosia sp. RR2S18]